MTDIVLVNPNAYGMSQLVSWNSPNLGIAYTASALENEGIDVKIIDSNYENFDDKKTCAILEKIDPQIVGIYSSSLQLREAVKIAKNVKKSLNAKTVIGGPHISSDPNFIKRFKCFDFGFVGESEVDFPKFTNRLLHGKKEKKLIFGEPQKNLDKIPFPSYHLLSFNKNYVITTKRKTSHVIISRGCPYNCAFCTVKKPPLRFRSPKNIIEEIKLLQDEYKINSILFECASFTLNRNQVLGICQELNKEKLDISWSCSTRCDLFDEGLAKNMKRAGCYNINFGVESGSYDTRKKIGKNFDDNVIKKVFEICRKHDILTGAFWLLGFPWETRQDIEKTIKFSIDLDANLSSYAPVILYPDTSLFKFMVKRKKIKSNAWDMFVQTGIAPLSVPDGFPREAVFQFVKEAYKKFYLRREKILFAIKKLNFDAQMLKRTFQIYS